MLLLVHCIYVCNNIGYSHFFTITNHTAMNNLLRVSFCTHVCFLATASVNHSRWVTSSWSRVSKDILKTALLNHRWPVITFALRQQGRVISTQITGGYVHVQPYQVLDGFSNLHSASSIFENSLAYSKNSQSSFLSSLYHTLLPHTTPGNFIHFCSFNK